MFTIPSDTKQIPGFDNYFVDIDGNIYTQQHITMRYSKPFNDGRARSKQEMIVRGCQKKLTLNKVTGYLQCAAVDNNNKLKTLYPHRCVALTFLGSAPDEKSVVDHLDSNRQNNSVSNLEWCSQKENVRRTWKRKLQLEETV